MSKRYRQYRQGETWEKAVVYVVGFLGFFGTYTWAESRISPDNLSIPLQWLVAGFGLAEGFLFAVVAWQLLELRHRRSRFSKARRRW